MKVALLCSGLGHINRGHEVFARDLFTLLTGDIDITLFKGGGEASAHEIVVPNVPRNLRALAEMHLPVSPKWHDAAVEVERMRVEGETFGYAALKPLLEGEFDVIHCLEQEVCNVIWGKRHLFRRTPKILWSNGGAIPAGEIPNCDFVQEHTNYNLARSAKRKAFMIPHGVNLQRFHPGVISDFRARNHIPPEAFVVISVGTICYWHKRMDYVIKEVASLPDTWLVIVGQESVDTPAIKALGRKLMGDRVIFTTLSHDELPKAYAAADVFTLGSLFETFGIVYIEAMAMGLPVVCTQHPNQRDIVQQGVFVDMQREGALAAALRGVSRETWRAIGERGPERARTRFNLEVLKSEYLQRYAEIAEATSTVPGYSAKSRLAANMRNAWRSVRQVLG